LVTQYTNTFSQSVNYHPFPDTVGYFWSVKYEHYDEVCMCVLDFSYIDILGDTMSLDGLVYRKVTFDQYFLIRQDITEKKIYARHYGPNFDLDTLEYLLYDFNLNIGDSVNLRTRSPLEFGPSYRFLTCTAIDSVYSSTGYRKRLKMEFSQPPFWSQATQQNYDYWVEGIGSMFNLFREVPDCFDFECQIQLGCFGKIDISGNPQYEMLFGDFCNELVMKSAELLPKEDFIVFQEGKIIRIKLPEGTSEKNILSLELIDLYGRKIQNLNYEGETYIENIVSGIYIVIVKTSTDIVSKKIFLIYN
jgi:hypothetical protein